MSPQARESTRDKVLRVAGALVSGGQVPLRMLELARAARISRATLYREFAGRRGLERQLRRRGILGTADSTAPSVRVRALAGARRAIADHGVLNVTMEQIARAAGVGEASIYREFENRDSVLRAAFDELPARQAILSLLRDPKVPLRATLVILVGQLLDFGEREPEILRLIAFGHGSESSYVRSLRRGQRSAYAQLVGFISWQQDLGRLNKRADPAQLAGALLGSVYVTSIQSRSSDPAHRSKNCNQDLNTRASELVDLFLNGAQAEAP